MLQLADIMGRAVWLFANRPGVRQGAFALNYAELGGRVVRLAGAMLGAGLAPGDRVAVLGRNSFRNLEIHLACAHAGLVLVPINIRLAASEIDRILALTRTRLLFQALEYDAGCMPSVRWDDDD